MRPRPGSSLRAGGTIGVMGEIRRGKIGRIDFLMARIAESEEYWRARRVHEIDRQSIDRVLAELDAKRQRIAAIGDLTQIDNHGIAIRLLMIELSPYADHPDYPVPL